MVVGLPTGSSDYYFSFETCRCPMVAADTMMETVPVLASDSCGPSPSEKRSACSAKPRIGDGWQHLVRRRCRACAPDSTWSTEYVVSDVPLFVLFDNEFR